jgi:prepilin signal peptidase PulO-like enzyme (type II secretory pathway)
MRSYIPFGPFLVAGAVVALLIDARILDVLR